MLICYCSLSLSVLHLLEFLISQSRLPVIVLVGLIILLPFTHPCTWYVAPLYHKGCISVLTWLFYADLCYDITSCVRRDQESQQVLIG